MNHLANEQSKTKKRIDRKFDESAVLARLLLGIISFLPRAHPNVSVSGEYTPEAKSRLYHAVYSEAGSMSAGEDEGGATPAYTGAAHCPPTRGVDTSHKPAVVTPAQQSAKKLKGLGAANRGRPQIMKLKRHSVGSFFASTQQNMVRCVPV
jgi:hypothetical protein